MTYKKEYPVLNDSGAGSLEEYTKRQEDRIESEFKRQEGRIESGFDEIGGRASKMENELSGITNRLGNLLFFSGSIEGNSPLYPKPIDPHQIPRSCMIKVFWINNDGSNRNKGIGEAVFSVESGEVSYITQEASGSLPVKMSVTPDKRNIQFNQTTGYWARIHYIILINKI